ncbi:hypothetical protein, partial [Sinorhizobium meliloti]|uniref:hypothetical protein n=1 Tax=Rhizobium meliloti TaxID=382 RepID=UPI001AEC373F
GGKATSDYTKSRLIMTVRFHTRNYTNLTDAIQPECRVSSYHRWKSTLPLPPLSRLRKSALFFFFLISFPLRFGHCGSSGRPQHAGRPGVIVRKSCQVEELTKMAPPSER